MNSSGHTSVEPSGVRSDALDARPLKVALVSTFPPRRCGIAEYSASLARAIVEQNADVTWWIAALADRPTGRQSSDVQFVLRSDSPDDYLEASDAINESGADLLLLQHEYGLFGGSYGRYLLMLLERVRIPVVTTLHTVLRAPTRDQADVLREILALSDAVVLLSRTAVELYPRYEPPTAPPVRLIRHGVPKLPIANPSRARPRVGLGHHRIVLSSGLLGPGKGIETMIDALPLVLEQHPEVMYVVVGTTHPSLLRGGVDDYRCALVERVSSAGLTRRVLFVDEFTPFWKLHQYLDAADLYIAPYREAEQVASGTLSTAIGAGSAIIATPFGHARELLADGRGVIVPFGDSPALADAINGLLAHEHRLSAMRLKAHSYAQAMLWDVAANQHLELFDELMCSAHARSRQQQETSHARAPGA